MRAGYVDPETQEPPSNLRMQYCPYNEGPLHPAMWPQLVQRHTDIGLICRVHTPNHPDFPDMNYGGRWDGICPTGEHLNSPPGIYTLVPEIDDWTVELLDD